MFQGWKTLIFSAAVALVGVAQAADWTNLLGSANAGYAITAIGVIGAVLRLFTNTPVGTKS
ncbi:MAG TPA: hypothetical protein VGN16_09475 [Acidobacteriaceae bacterium]|jgi:hypothetical protein